METPRFDREEENKIFFAAPEWAKGKAFKYYLLIKASKGLKGGELKAFLDNWNETAVEAKTSYQSLMRARKIYYREGIKGLMPKYGKSKGKSSVNDEHFEMFKELYLSVLKPSVKACVEEVKNHFGNNLAFPSPISFLRRLKREIPQSEIDYARN